MDKSTRHEMIEKFIAENRHDPERYMVCPPASEAEVMMSFKERDELRKQRRREARRRRG